jgi:hypothetical protein
MSLDERRVAYTDTLGRRRRRTRRAEERIHFDSSAPAAAGADDHPARQPGMPMNGWRLSFPSPAAVGNSSTRVESGSVNEAGGSDDRPALGTSQATTVNSSEKVSDLSTPSRPSIPHETVQQDKRPFIRSLVAMRWPSTSTCFTRYLGHQARSGCPTLTLKRPGLVGLFGRPSCSDPELDAGELIVPDCTVGCDGRRHHRRWPYGRHYRLDETDASTPTSSKVHLPRASLSHREASHWTGDQEHVRRPISVEKQHTTRRLSETPAGSELSRRPARVSSPCIGSEIQQRGKLAKCLATGCDLSEINSNCGKSSLGVM